MQATHFSQFISQNRGGGRKARSQPKKRCSRAYYRFQACPDDHTLPCPLRASLAQSATRTSNFSGRQPRACCRLEDFLSQICCAAYRVGSAALGHLLQHDGPSTGASLVLHTKRRAEGGRQRSGGDGVRQGASSYSEEECSEDFSARVSSIVQDP